MEKGLKQKKAFNDDHYNERGKQNRRSSQLTTILTRVFVVIVIVIVVIIYLYTNGQRDGRMEEQSDVWTDGRMCGGARVRADGCAARQMNG